MKLKLIILSMAAFVFCASQVFAASGHDHGSHDEGGYEEVASSESMNVGNKICPVSGEVIAEVSPDGGVQVEHEGKVYNLCCKMCAKDFKKNPEAFIKKINEELEHSNDHEDHDEDKENESKEGHHKGSGHHDHSDHDH